MIMLTMQPGRKGTLLGAVRIPQKLLYLRIERNRGRCAGTGDRDRGGSGCLSESRLHGGVSADCRKEITTEGITRSGSVYGGNLEDGMTEPRLLLRIEYAVVPQSHNDRGMRIFHRQAVKNGFIGSIGLHSDKLGCFQFVYDEIIYQIERNGRKVLRHGGRIERNQHPFFMRFGDDGCDQVRFVLEERHVSRHSLGQNRIDICIGEHLVRAAVYDNTILAFGVDFNNGMAAWCVQCAYLGSIDAGFLQDIREEGSAASDHAGMENLRAGSCCRNGLIQALAAGRYVIISCMDGLSGSYEFADVIDVVDIERAKINDFHK